MLPQSWSPLSSEERAGVLSQMGAAGVGTASASTSFMANLADPATRRNMASFNVRFYPEEIRSQSDARAIADDFHEFDQAIAAAMTEASSKAGWQLAKWFGTTEGKVGSHIALITSYLRTAIAGSGTNELRFVRLYRVWDEGRSFTITISYDNVYRSTFEPTEKIILESIKQ